MLTPAMRATAQLLEPSLLLVPAAAQVGAADGMVQTRVMNG
jgi:hypothetical protein